MDMNELIASITDKDVDIEDVAEEEDLNQIDSPLDHKTLDDQSLSQD